MTIGFTNFHKVSHLCFNIVYVYCTVLLYIILIITFIKIKKIKIFINLLFIYIFLFMILLLNFFLLFMFYFLGAHLLHIAHSICDFPENIHSFMFINVTTYSTPIIDFIII